MTLMSLLIFALILVLAFYLIRMIPDPTIQKIVMIIVIVFALLWLLQGFGAIGFLNQPVRVR